MKESTRIERSNRRREKSKIKRQGAYDWNMKHSRKIRKQQMASKARTEAFFKNPHASKPVPKPEPKFIEEARMLKIYAQK